VSAKESKFFQPFQRKEVHSSFISNEVQIVLVITEKYSSHFIHWMFKETRDIEEDFISRLHKIKFSQLPFDVIWLLSITVDQHNGSEMESPKFQLNATCRIAKMNKYKYITGVFDAEWFCIKNKMNKKTNNYLRNYWVCSGKNSEFDL